MSDGTRNRKWSNVTIFRSGLYPKAKRKDDNSHTPNYRPILLLTALPKILQSYICIYVYKHKFLDEKCP